MEAHDFTGNIERFTGFAPLYDQHRPGPPEVLGNLLCQFAGISRPQLVIDLGSGTGISTRYWAPRANRVIGIEPTDAMREHAVSLGGGDGITYQKGFSHETGLPNQCAEIATCSQSLHWMEPKGTFAEVARILKPGGVFAAADYDWPPVTGFWKVDAAFDACMKASRALEANHHINERVQQWNKEGHLARMQASGVFCYTREADLHHADLGTADRLVGNLLSQGHIQILLKQGVSEKDLGIEEFRELAKTVIGPRMRRFYWSCRVRIGVV